MSCNLPFFVENYFALMDKYPHRFCKCQCALRENVIIPAFENEDLYVDTEQALKYFGLSKYLGYEQIFEWEEFVLGLHLCVYIKESGLPRWPDALVLMGRGNGKDGVISLESLSLISPYNPIDKYDVDICANNEDQAKRPVNDIIEAFETQRTKMLKFFYWTKVIITGRKCRSYIKGHTNNAKGKDGLRSGIVIFNEYHAYENYDNINVFKTGLGKKPHPRTTIFTTNGNVVDGPLDELIKTSEEILFNGQPDDGFLPFICRLDSKEEVHDEEKWHKANPSLMYLPNLMIQIRKDYKEWNKSHSLLPDFMTKRMNIRENKNELPVTAWENILATNKWYEGKLLGLEASCGIDLSKTTDWASVNMHIKIGEARIDINHAWICMNNPEIGRLKCPYEQWAEEGHITLVHDVEISPQLIVNYIKGQMAKYKIKIICLDSYRYDIMKDYLEKIGFSIQNKNIYLVRPSDIMRVQPMIDRAFVNQYFYWGNQPHLRWATNNTKLVRTKKSKLVLDGELDVGNYLYGKIEPKSRKTDPFMSLVHSFIGEDKTKNYAKKSTNRKRPGVVIF